jgi:hypothetical protein
MVEWQLKNPGGGERHLLSGRQAERDKQGVVVRYLGILNDVSGGHRHGGIR